jgi:sporulation protein YabP
MAEVVHQLQMDNREMLSITGILNVGSFDEEELVLETKMGIMVLQGEGLHVTQLNLDEGKLVVEGLIKGITYAEERGKGLKLKGRHILDRLLK